MVQGNGVISIWRLSIPLCDPNLFVSSVSLYEIHHCQRSGSNELVQTSWYDCSVLSVQLHIDPCIHSVELDAIQNLNRRRNLCYTTSTDGKRKKEKKIYMLEKTPLNTSHLSKDLALLQERKRRAELSQRPSRQDHQPCHPRRSCEPQPGWTFRPSFRPWQVWELKLYRREA